RGRFISFQVLEPSFHNNKIFVLLFSGGLSTLPPHSREYHIESRSWSAAQSYCRTYHTDLTSIRSKEEKSNITLTLNESGVEFVWIGLYRDPWAPWSDNTTSTFTNWLSGQPNNYFPPEDCVAFNLNTGKWCDSNCSTREIRGVTE
uniref:C-type lectin domain-containing protein n=1 Tax=Pundamilia nyererei TaxID=303518 RepID=A0A3B4GFF3_9CICH